MLLGFIVGWKKDGPVGTEYEDICADVIPGSNVFKRLQDANTVLAGERLKSASLDWHIYELHERDE